MLDLTYHAKFLGYIIFCCYYARSIFDYVL
jgi:hypothetical protein